MLFKQKKISVCIGMLCGSIAISASVQGQVIPPEYGQKIGDVVVSASLVGTELKDMTQNTSILTNEDIKNAPDQTIDQVFKNQSSVFLNDTPYFAKDMTGQSINVRGLGNQRTLVLIDGVPANNAMYGTVEWNRAPISAVEDVEFIRGGVSNLYGNMGMGGVVNITTKPISDNKGEVSASYGSYGTGNVAASKELAINDVLKIRVSADYFATDGYVVQPTISPATAYPNKKTTSVSANQAAPLLPGIGPASANAANYRLDGSLKLNSDTDAFFKMGSHNFTNLMGPGYSFLPKTMQQTTFSTGVSTRLSSNQRIDANAYYENGNLWQQNVTNSPPRSPYMSSNYENPFSTVGASAKYLQQFQNFVVDEVMLGVDGRQVAAQNLTNSFSAPSSTTSNQPGSMSSSAYAKGQQQFYGVMTQLKSKASFIPLQTTLTLREDQWQSQTPTYWMAGSNGVPGYTNIPNQTVYKFSPNLGFLLQATKELDFRAAAYQGFHAPGLNNTIRSYASSTSVSLSNPNLTPENMTGFEIGTDYRWNAGFIQVTGFSAQVQNAVYAPNVTQAQAYAAGCPVTVCTGANGQTFNLYGNNQNLQSQGLEVQAHHDLSTHWALDGTYTHTNTIITWTGAGVNTTLNPIGSQVGGVPQNMGYAAVTYTPFEKTSVSANIRYIGNSWMDTPHTLPVPSYAIIGLRANYQVSPQASVFASVVNLFNRTYITYNAATSQASYTLGQPQSVNVGARITF
jgi:iron complex outermembrane receptor protein